MESVKKFFEEKNLNFKTYEMDKSTATVELAANAHGIEPKLIAKTMAFKLKDRSILIVTKGDDWIFVYKSRCSTGDIKI
nr:hypothetical protein [Anaerophilus nitritogenes]